MKKILLPFYSCLLFLSIACNTSTPSENPAENEPAETDSTPTEAEASSAPDYEIEVVDPAPKSPRKEMRTKLAGGSITINYGSPKVKGRIIWGGLEEYGVVWRAGANEATRFETTADLTIQGGSLPAGKYSFFLIPKEQGPWIAIFNAVYEQWGAYEYDESKDVLRVEVNPVMKEENQESLDYVVEGGAIVMRWAKVELTLDVQ
ncbi:MAG: DUF2911 domain-containing protein [Saprospiraceae bacterium]|nr:DUF2911 domain-containing protein [Saprospiraceae bacterium]